MSSVCLKHLLRYPPALPTIRVHPELDGRMLDIVHSLKNTPVVWLPFVGSWIINEFEKLGKLWGPPGKQNLRVTCPTGKVEFKYFSSPATCFSCISSLLSLAGILRWLPWDMLLFSTAFLYLLVPALLCLFVWALVVVWPFHCMLVFLFFSYVFLDRRGKFGFLFNKLTSGFYASVLLLIMNFVITLSK